jgi:hypothetical protein
LDKYSSRYRVGGSLVNIKPVSGISVNTKPVDGSSVNKKSISGRLVISKDFGGNSVNCRYSLILRGHNPIICSSH